MKTTADSLELETVLLAVVTGIVVITLVGIIALSNGSLIARQCDRQGEFVADGYLYECERVGKHE